MSKKINGIGLYDKVTPKQKLSIMYGDKYYGTDKGNPFKRFSAFITLETGAVWMVTLVGDRGVRLKRGDVEIMLPRKEFEENFINDKEGIERTRRTDSDA